MTKRELIERMHEKFPHYTQDKVKDIVNLIIDQMAQTLINGERVEIRHFAVMRTKIRSERKSRNPKTGRTFILAPRPVIGFKQSRTWMQKINNKD